MTKILVETFIDKVLVYKDRVEVVFNFCKDIKDTVGKAVSKAIPVIGGLLSGGLTVATFLPMAKVLQKELSKFVAMSPEDLAEASASADVILADFADVTEEPST